MTRPSLVTKLTHKKDPDFLVYLWHIKPMEHQLSTVTGNIVKEWDGTTLPEIMEQLSIDYEVIQ